MVGNHLYQNLGRASAEDMEGSLAHKVVVGQKVAAVMECQLDVEGVWTAIGVQ